MAPTWRNHTGNQVCHPREIVRPRSLEDLVDLVRRAERDGTTSRAVDAGHSWSDVTLADGLLVEPDGLGGLAHLDDGTLRADVARRPLVRVLGGTHLRDLNAAIGRVGLALPNMSGHDAQTIAGVDMERLWGEFLPVPREKCRPRRTDTAWASGLFATSCARSTSWSRAVRSCASSLPMAPPTRPPSPPRTARPGASSRMSAPSTPPSARWAAWSSCTRWSSRCASASGSTRCAR